MMAGLHYVPHFPPCPSRSDEMTVALRLQPTDRCGQGAAVRRVATPGEEFIACSVVAYTTQHLSRVFARGLKPHGYLRVPRRGTDSLVKMRIQSHKPLAFMLDTRPS